VTRLGSNDLLSVGDQLTEAAAIAQAEWVIKEFGEVNERAQSA
jgi:hypothetical protein